jgi:hypothetical protein
MQYRTSDRDAIVAYYMLIFFFFQPTCGAVVTKQMYRVTSTSNDIKPHIFIYLFYMYVL